MLTLRPPKPDEAVALTELCLRAKAAWGYDAAFMAACRDELTLTRVALGAPHLQVAEIDGALAGIAQLTVKGAIAELDKLFVEPARFGAGGGRALFAWARETARRAGARVLVVDSDPNAVGFYRAMGATDDGVVASGSLPGRFIPRLKLVL
jgi:GNAT superfamily N-acetyltransferase